MLARTLLGLLVGSLVAACDRWGNEATKIKVIFTETDPSRRLIDLYFEEGGDLNVVTGSDEAHLRDLAAGEVETINLLPRPEDSRQLGLRYRLDSDVSTMGRFWRGPKFDRGTGYRIEIKINGRGEVTERHCILPCSLD